MKLTTETFIDRATTVHGDLYDYSVSKYTSMSNHIKINCVDHGEFDQIARDHLRGRGCPDCGYKKMIAESQRQRTRAQIEFTEKARLIHGSQYTYEHTEYLTAIQPVVITCPVHGKFKQTPNDHLHGKGCAKCGRLKSAINKKINSATLAINESIVKHGNLYDYSKVDISKGVVSPVTIICKIHGQFEQSLRLHKNSGCPKCGRDQAPGWYSKRRLYDTNTAYTPTRLYVCRVWDENEEFYKIGITKLPMDKRMSEIKKHYEWTMVDETIMPALTAVSIERNAKRLLRQVRYIPHKKFGGYTECYKDIISINEAIASSLADVHLPS